LPSSYPDSCFGKKSNPGDKRRIQTTGAFFGLKTGNNKVKTVRMALQKDFNADLLSIWCGPQTSRNTKIRLLPI
jgi:hypothetical protein